MSGIDAQNIHFVREKGELVEGALDDGEAQLGVGELAADELEDEAHLVAVVEEFLGVAQLGLGLVPEGRQIFPNLNVRENLVATAADRGKADKPWTLDRVCELFPRLRERFSSMGNQLSGGEQQMLAVGRALMTNPRLLILDEATEGLAPLIREEIWQCLTRLKQAGQSILVIDKNVGALTRIADRHYVIERGKVMWKGTSAELAAAPDVQHRYLGI